jgi:glycosyltransferase involved in cell wall biosynthesis
MTEPRLCNETIVILANAEWDWENRVNCHHLAARLARDNRVLFVDTVGGRTPAPREFKKVLGRLRRIAGGVRSIDEHLTVLSPLVIPVYGQEAFNRLNAWLLARQIRRALRPQRCSANPRPIMWLFLPSLVGLVGRFHEKLVIYHCVDEHSANPRVPARQVAKWERQLLRRADVVFTTASTLYESKRGLNPNTHYLPNVADAAHFARARAAEIAPADELKNISHPIAGFVGNVTAYKLDFDLLVQVARARPEWSFVLLGPVGRGDPSTDVSQFTALPNLHLLGPRPYAELPRYVKAFDVCLIPFNQNESTRGSLPMKFFEYLAAGKPVVATDLPSLAEFRDYFYPANGAAEFASALSAASQETSDRSNARVRLADKYSWDKRMVEIGQIVKRALATQSAA